MRIVFRKCFFFKPKKNRRDLTLLSLLKSMLLLILGYLFCLFVLVRLLCGVFYIQFSAITVVDSDSFILSDYGVGSSKTSRTSKKELSIAHLGRNIHWLSLQERIGLSAIPKRDVGCAQVSTRKSGLSVKFITHHKSKLMVASSNFLKAKMTKKKNRESMQLSCNMRER